jgi:hypothetical protein
MPYLSQQAFHRALTHSAVISRAGMDIDVRIDFHIEALTAGES